MVSADDIHLFWEIFDEDPQRTGTQKYRYLAESYQGKITILSDISGKEKRRVKREVEKALKELKPRTAKNDEIIRNAIKEMEKRWQQQFGFTEETMQLLGRKVEESCIIFEHEGIVSYGMPGFGLCGSGRFGLLHVTPDLWIVSGDKFFFPLYVRYAATVALAKLVLFPHSELYRSVSTAKQEITKVLSQLEYFIKEMLYGLEAAVEKIIPRHTWNPQIHPLQAVLLEWKETPKEGPQIYQKLLNNPRMAAHFAGHLSSLVPFSTHAIVEVVNRYNRWADAERIVRGVGRHKRGLVKRGLSGVSESFLKAEVGIREAISSTRTPLSQLTRALTFNIDPLSKYVH